MPSADGDELAYDARLFPRRAFDVALREARKTREREQRALTPAELEALRRFYPDVEYSQQEAILTYQTTGRIYKPGPLPVWDEIGAELSAEPASAKEARLLERQVDLARRSFENERVSAGESGRPRITLNKETLFVLFERGLERARSTERRRQPSYERIADEVGLKRTWVTPIVKWAERHQLEARKAIVSVENPLEVFDNRC